MHFLEIAKQRYSVRTYADTPVEEEKLQQILEAGRLAPTATNCQCQRIYVLKSEEALAKAGSVSRFTYGAPLILLVCYDSNVSWKGTYFGDNDYDGGEVDASIVTTMMMCQATELGLGTTWIRGYSNQDMIDTFALPENIKPVCLLLIGYAAQDAAGSSTRKPLEETVTIL